MEEAHDPAPEVHVHQLGECRALDAVGGRAARLALDHAAGIANDDAHAVVDAAAVGVAPLMRREAPTHTAAAAFLRPCAPAAAMDQ